MAGPSLAAIAALMLVGGSIGVRAEEVGPAVVPYRPSVASPAELPAPGWPEMEAGMRWAKGGDSARSEWAPVTFKLAWNDSWGMMIGTYAYEWQRGYDGSEAHTIGDTLLVLKYKLPVDDHLALGAEFGVSLPTARAPIGNGATDWGINTIASFDYPGVHVDVNLAAARRGAVDAGQGPWQGAWAIAVSNPIDLKFGVTAEVAGVAQHGTTAQTQALLGMNYAVSRTLVLDVAVAAGLSQSSPSRQLMFGMTMQLGHWF
jgi:hypothetical protein